MRRPLDQHTARLLRMRSQGLSGEPATTVLDAVRRAGAIQAQATAPARLAVRARSSGLDADAVTRACNDERSVVRTWALRGTLHMVPAEDVGWMVGLLGPVFVATGRRRRLQLGLDDDVLAGGVAAIREVLGAQGPLPRADLVRRVHDMGVDVALKGQAGPHLVGYAALKGLICRGPDLAGDEPSYVLLEDWVGVPRPLGEDAALAELARRYLAAYGPATVTDFATWSGLKMGQARRGFAAVSGEFADVEVAGEAALTPVVDLPAGAPCVRLLPHFDAYLLGYRRRDLSLAPAFARRIQAGGWISAAVVVDGRVIGTWRREGRRLTVDPFERLDRTVRAGIEAETADVGRFLGTGLSLSVEKASPVRQD